VRTEKCTEKERTGMNLAIFKTSPYQNASFYGGPFSLYLSQVLVNKKALSEKILRVLSISGLSDYDLIHWGGL
jgi:hypothetical protein